jgi:hypothetical protein
MLPDHPAGSLLRDTEDLPDMLDAGTAAGRALKFPLAFGP